MCIWIIALLPQFVSNMKTKNCESQSIYYWMLLMSGDISNLIGCLLSQQLPTMTGLAFIYLTLSSSMFSQYVYYTYYNKSERVDDDKGDSLSDGNSNRMRRKEDKYKYFNSPRQPYLKDSPSVSVNTYSSRLLDISFVEEKIPGLNLNYSKPFESNKYIKKTNITLRAIIFPIFYIVAVYLYLKGSVNSTSGIVNGSGELKSTTSYLLKESQNISNITITSTENICGININTCSKNIGNKIVLYYCGIVINLLCICT